jgi:hypothetical protein
MLKSLQHRGRPSSVTNTTWQLTGNLCHERTASISRPRPHSEANSYVKPISRTIKTWMLLQSSESSFTAQVGNYSTPTIPIVLSLAADVPRRHRARADTRIKVWKMRGMTKRSSGLGGKSASSGRILCVYDHDIVTRALYVK